MEEKRYKFLITLLWLVTTAGLFVVGYAAGVSEVIPLYLKIPVIGSLVTEETWVTIAWVDGLGG